MTSRARLIADTFSPVQQPDLSSGLGAEGITSYATAAELPLTGVDAGTQAFVEETNRFYVNSGDGWYNIALINQTPTITEGAPATVRLALDGTPTVITLVAEDPEGIPITWSYTVTSGTLGNTATISQADNVFTITPSTDENDDGSFTVTFTASDGVNIASSSTEFELAFTTIFSDDATSDRSSEYYEIGRTSWNSGGYYAISGGDNVNQRTSIQALAGAPFPDVGVFRMRLQKTADYPTDNQSSMIISTREIPWTTMSGFSTEDEITLSISLTGSGYSRNLIYNLGGLAADVTVPLTYAFDDQSSIHTFELFYSPTEYSMVVDGTTEATIALPNIDTSRFISAAHNMFQISGRMYEFTVEAQ